MPNTPSSGLPHPLSYDTSVEGIVTDNVTGLIWQKEPASFSVTQKDAANVCKALNLGGHTDWRLPSRLELVSLLAIERESGVDSTAFPASPLDTEAFPGPEEVTSGWTWSSSLFPSMGDEPVWALATRFGDGFTWDERLPGGWLSRCARQDP